MILTILKVIGIVLLSLLGLILLLAILALVLPVRYRLACNAEEGSRPTALLKISYFIGLFRARADYTDALYIKVKVLFFTIFQMKIPDKEEDEGEEYDLSELDEALEALDDDEEEPVMSEDIPEADAEDDTEATEDEPENDESDEPEISDEISEEEARDESEEPVEPEESAYDKIRSKIDEICDKIKRARSEIRYYRNLYNSNEAKNALFVIKKRLMRILKKLMPRRAHADVIFGFDSPDLTGKVYGIYTLFAKRFDKTSKVDPDFDRKVFEGNIYCKGHFNAWCILWNGLAIILNKNVRKIYKSFKHHNKKKENEGAAEEKAA